MRLFIAIECPDDVRDRLAKVQEELPGLGRVKAVEYENLHMTLKFLGEVQEDKVQAVREALETVKSGPFTADIGGLGVFPSPGNARVIWAGLTKGDIEMRRLQKKVDETLGPVGFPPDKRFHPHYTLARTKEKLPGDKVKELLEKHRGTLFGSFVVGSFILMKSTLTPKGPIYETVSAHNLG